MPNHYNLDFKINALNLIDRHDGDVQLAAQSLELAERTLYRWLGDEDSLRQQYRSRQQRRRARLLEDLQVQMLEQSRAILARLDEQTLKEAPLNQLATTLNSLLSHALKLEETIDQLDTSEEQVVRFEYYYDGALHGSPPWARRSEDGEGALQGSRLRTEVGQDPSRQDDHPGERPLARQEMLVAGTDFPYGDTGLARLENKPRP